MNFARTCAGSANIQHYDTYATKISTVKAYELPGDRKQLAAMDQASGARRDYSRHTRVYHAAATGAASCVYTGSFCSF